MYSWMKIILRFLSFERLSCIKKNQQQKFYYIVKNIKILVNMSSVFVFHLQAITWKRYLSIPRQLVQRNQNISSQKAVTRIFHIWTVYKKSVSGLIVAKDSIGHKIIHALSTSTIWDKIFIIYSNKQCHCTESAKWSMLESFDSYAIKLV